MELSLPWENHILQKDNEINLDDLKKGVMYPDRGGYTGFFFGWQGGFFEARFFVFGSLPDHRFLELTPLKALIFANALFKKWKPIMDKIVENERKLMSDPDKKGIHKDEVFTDDLKLELYI